MSETESIHAIARAKKEAEQEAFDQYQRQVEKAKNLWFLIYILLTATAVGAVWTTSMQFKVTAVEETQRERRTQLDRIETKLNSYVETNNLAMQTMATLSNSLTEGLKESRAEYREMRPKVDQMWWMKERGLTNKDVGPVVNP